MKFKENLRFLRKANHLSQDRLAEILGYKSFTTVQKWEDGSAFPKVENLNRLARIFNVDLDHLLNIDLSVEKIAVPIIGEVKAGYDMYAFEDILGYEYLNNNEYQPGEYFYLKVKGDSMKEARILEGDLVYVRKQDYLDDKDIGVFLLENNEVTVKRILYKKDKIILHAENSSYADREFKKDDDLKILGRVIHNKVLL